MGQGCSVSFQDEEFSKDKVSSVYYVRAIQQESLAVGGDPLRCEKNEKGEFYFFKKAPFQFTNNPVLDRSHAGYAPLEDKLHHLLETNYG